ncbi:hypothetical protein [Gimesia sp.]|uniref:hypothetical protein n=1 Tax=Gimesia sp. TaxID=2024833 RepID=UPI0032ED48F5
MLYHIFSHTFNCKLPISAEFDTVLYMSPKPKKKSRKNEIIRASVTSEEKARFEAAAYQEDKYLAEVIRELLTQYSDKILGKEDH